MFYIKNIQIYSGTNTVSNLPLINGLNIIYGPSNTGKSLVYECIDFLFGGEAMKLHNPALKIKAIKGIIDVDGKELSLYRELGDSNFVVSGKVDRIEPGSYTTGKGSKKTPPINRLWLQLMGLTAEEENVKIFQYQNGKSQSLTLRTFIHTFLIDETRLGANNSILKSAEGYSKNIPVSTITSLAYLATGNNYNADQPKEGIDSEVFDARKSAAKKLIDLSTAALAQKSLISLPQLNDGRSVDDLQQDINEILTSIEFSEGELNEAIEKSELLGREIIETEEKIAECRMLSNRFDSLESQYESDVRRLTFIAEGEIRKDVSVVERCPFCNGELTKKQSESCVEAAVAEANKIKVKISDLMSAKQSISKELAALNDRKKSVVSDRQELQKRIRGNLRPKVDNLRERLISYSSALERAKAEEMREKVISILNEKMEEVIAEEQVAPEIRFDVSSVIRSFLKSPMEDHLKKILQDSRYENFIDARFDEELCDVVVNGCSKLSQGQGYRAFLNTAMAVALQETIDGYNLYKLPLMVADSPIMSLKEVKEDKDTKVPTDGMKSGLFRYMVEHCQCKQTIIMENSIPKLDYKNTNLIHFTKDENEGIYGLISDYRE
jgi:hypothetical protein